MNITNNRKHLLPLSAATALALSAQAQYTFEKVEAPGFSNIQAVAINSSGTITGNANWPIDSGGFSGYDNLAMFIREGSVMTAVTIPGPRNSTVATGINNSGTICGNFLFFTSLPIPGFTRTQDGQVTSPITDTAGKHSFHPAAIDDKGELIGGNFVFDRGNYVFVSVASPGARPAGTQLIAVNSAGVILGQDYEFDSGGNFVSRYFLSDAAGGELKGFDGIKLKSDVTLPTPAGVAQWSPTALDASGVVAGNGTDTQGASHGFLLKNGQLTTIDFPAQVWPPEYSVDDPIAGGTLHFTLYGANPTTISGLNDQGDIVGYAAGYYADDTFSYFTTKFVSFVGHPGR